MTNKVTLTEVVSSALYGGLVGFCFYSAASDPKVQAAYIGMAFFFGMLINHKLGRVAARVDDNI